MNQKLRFLYRLLKILPFKPSRLRIFLDLLRFYYNNNTVTIFDNKTKLVNPLKLPRYLHVKIHGNCHGNNIFIQKQQKYHGRKPRLYFEFFGGNNHTIEIGKDNMVTMHAYIQGNGGHIKIGDNNLIWGAELYFYCSGETTFTIGNNNLFSDEIVLWGAEGHSVINPKTRMVTNIGGNITIGDNNWVCKNVCFLKRAKIGSGCIVGYGAVVGGDFSDENKCVIAGNPAQLVKRDILWAEQEPWNYNGGLYRLD